MLGVLVLIFPLSLLTGAGQIAQAREVSSPDPNFCFEIKTATNIPEQLLKSHKVYTGAETPMRIALTFDDGPNPLYTQRILDLLAKYDAKATFFLVGTRIEAYPGLARKLVEAGMEVANHTLTHPNVAKLPMFEAIHEIEANAALLRQVTGVRTYLWRPPGGDFSPELLARVSERGYLTVLWSTNTADYKNPGVPELERAMLLGAKPGAIYLLHTGAEQTLEALPFVLETLSLKGYSFVTVSQLLGLTQQQASVTAVKRRPALATGALPRQ